MVRQQNQIQRKKPQKIAQEGFVLMKKELRMLVLVPLIVTENKGHANQVIPLQI